jgi:O-antigen/teichoic acid export membrane protein
VVISLVSVPLFLHYLGTERYGLYEAVGALAMWLGLTNAGMSLGLVNKLADCYVTGDRELARRFVTSLMFALPVVALAAMLVLSIVTPFVPWARLFRASPALQGEIAWAFWSAGVVTLLGVVVSSAGAIYSGYQEIVRNNVWDAVAKVMTLAGCVAVIYTPLGVTGAILATAGVPTIVRGINLLGIFAFEKPFLRPLKAAFDWRLLRVLLVEGGSLLVLQLSAIALFQTDKLIVGLVKGPAQVAEFSVIGRLYFTAYALFVLLIGPLWPTAAEAIRRGDIPWVRRQLRRSLMLSCVGMFVVGIAMYIGGERLVRIWTRGAQPTMSRALIVGMTATFVVRCWTECQSAVLNAASVLKPQTYVLVTNAALNLVLAWGLVHRYGVVGAAWSIPITTLLTSGWIYPLLIRRHIYSIIPPARAAKQ